jgi:MFS family permease
MSTAEPHATGPKPTLFNQPRAVYAVAFACVISFMGIGLVDPILPALSQQLHATPSQVTLLFTSYLVVTAVMMLVTNWVSSRIGAKKTLITGLVLIVIFSALAGSTGTISGIVAFRAGWGLGNALFIATSLAAIVASARGGFAGAIILYEAALGLGIAAGPLLGGTLGNISWRGPFFGVAVLMALALVATLFLLPPTPRPDHRTSLSAPLRALRHRGLLLMSLAALCYNWAFFTMLGYAPFPMKLGAIQLGWVFFGWGVLVAFFAVLGAPWLQRRFGTAKSLYVALTLFAADLAVIAVFPTVRMVLVVCVITAGIFIGVNNTLTTQAVMIVAPVERPVASAAYGFVRFIGGGLAPFVAGKLVEHYNLHVPFAIACGTALLAVLVLTTAHHELANADAGLDEDGTPAVSLDDVAGEVGDEYGGAGGAIDQAAAARR